MSDGARGSDLDHWRWLERHRLAGDWRGRAVLDLGCGSGWICQRLREAGAGGVVGVDLLAPAVPPRDWTHLRLDLDQSDWHERLRGDAGVGRFDRILAFDVLEHLASPVRFLESCRAVASPEALLVLTTPNTASWERWLRPERWSGATDPQHKILFSKYSLGFLLRRLGWTVTIIEAPVRRLAFLGPLAPDVGAQIFCVAQAARK